MHPGDALIGSKTLLFLKMTYFIAIDVVFLAVVGVSQVRGKIVHKGFDICVALQLGIVVSCGEIGNLQNFLRFQLQRVFWLGYSSNVGVYESITKRSFMPLNQSLHAHPGAHLMLLPLFHFHDNSEPVR